MPGIAGSAIFAAAAFLLLWPVARMDFDRHHDGYMLAQAMAVHQGNSVHADVFAQYGPVTPWVQSLALFLPIGPGLALRTLDVAFIALTTFFLADMGRRGPRDWPISRAVGWWAGAAWIILADVWMGFPLLPWSSTLASMLSVATLYLLMRSVRYAEDGSIRAVSITALCGGVLLGLIPFTRINVGLSALAVCFLGAALLFMERGLKRKAAGLYMVGAFSSLITVMVVLAYTSSLTEFYYQSIQWPLTWGQGASGDWQTRTNLTRIFAQQAGPVGLAGAALFLRFRARTEHPWSFSQSGMNVFGVLVGLVIVVVENMRVHGKVPEQLFGRRVVSYLHILVPNAGYLYFFMVLSVVFSVLTLLTIAFKFLSCGSSRGRLLPWVFLAGLALSGFTQLIPTWDPYHVWWGFPLGLLLLFSTVRFVANLNRPSENPLMLPLFLTGVMAILSASVYWTAHRVEGEPGTLIEGMFVPKSEFDAINQDTQFLGAHLGDSKSIVYLVEDGDLSVLDARYRSAGPYFVDWGGAPSAKTRIAANRNPIVVQTSYLSIKAMNELALSIKYKVVARNARLVVLIPMETTSGS